MWGWDSICSAARKIDRTVREDAPAKLKQYTPDPKQLQHVARYCARSYPAEKLSDIPKIMQGNWDSVCFVDQKIDKTVKENAPYQRFLITAGKYALEDFIMGSGLPGARPLYRAWKESLRNRSSVASQLDSQDKENGERIPTEERESAKSEASILHLQLVAETKRSRTQAKLSRTLSLWGWDSTCSAARKIDRTVREDAPAKLKQYTPDPKQLQHVARYCAGSYPAEKLSDIPKIMQGNWDSVCFVARKIHKTVTENAPDSRIFLTTAVKEIINDSGLPGARPLCRAWKESRRNRSGVASQMHSHDKVNGERISTDERERANFQDCSDDVDREDK